MSTPGLGTFNLWREVTAFLNLFDFPSVPAVCSKWRQGVSAEHWATGAFPRHQILARIHRAGSAAAVRRAVDWVDLQTCGLRWNTGLCGEAARNIMENRQEPNYLSELSTPAKIEKYMFFGACPAINRVVDTATYYDVPEVLRLMLMTTPNPTCLESEQVRNLAITLLNSHVKADVLFMPAIYMTPWRRLWNPSLHEQRKRRRPERVLIAHPVEVRKYLVALAHQEDAGPFDARDDPSWEDEGDDEEEKVPYNRELTRYSCTFIAHQRALDCLDDNDSFRNYNYYEDSHDSCSEEHVSWEADTVIQMVHALLVHKGQVLADKEAKARVIEKGLYTHWDEDYVVGAYEDYFERRVCAELTSTYPPSDRNHRPRRSRRPRHHPS